MFNPGDIVKRINFSNVFSIPLVLEGNLYVVDGYYGDGLKLEGIEGAFDAANFIREEFI